MQRELKNWIKGYLTYTESMEAPYSFRLWSAISTIAGALRGKVWFDMGYWKWKPNFYVVFVAPPGIATKSTAFGVGSKLLSSIPGINMGADSSTWQAMTEALAQNVDEVPIDGEFVPMSCVTFSVSELGTFLDPGNGEMIDVLVDLWDGRDANKPWIRRTKKGGEEIIPSPFINFIAGTTPGWIQDRMTEYTIGGGLASRTVYVYADKKDRLVAYPFLHLNGEAHDLYKKLLADLVEISNLVGPFVASAEALLWGESWYKQHWTVDAPAAQNDRLSGYMARKQTHLHKIAMVLSASDRQDRIITKAHMETAHRILGRAEQDMIKSFSLVTGNNESVQFQTRVLNYLQEFSDPVEAGDFYSKKLVMHMGFQEYNRSIAGLVASGLVHRIEREGKILLAPKHKAVHHQPTTSLL